MTATNNNKSFVENFVKEQCIEANSPYENCVRYKTFSLEPYITKKTKIKKVKKIESAKASFVDMLVINSMWREYIKDLTGKLKGDSLLERFLKADYHGAKICVFKSSQPNLIGREGIVIQEKQNIFIVVSKDDKVFTVPKKNCVFRVFLNEEETFLLYGNEFCVRPAERLTKKWKDRKPFDYK